MSIKKQSFSFIFKVIVPLFSGIAIYALWRGIYILNIEPLITSFPPGWILFNLPDGLWFYALLSSLVLIWKNGPLKNMVFWLSIAILFSIIFEIFQSWGIIPGTFDWFDLLAYLIAGILVIIPNLKILNIKTLTIKNL